MKGGVLFAFAGVWRPTEGGERFAFLTAEPNELVSPVRAKAMAVILARGDFDRWLATDYAGACAQPKPYPADAMRIVD